MQLQNKEVLTLANQLIEQIHNYESDTFSASAEGLSKEQAQAIFELFLYDSLDRLDTMLDGHMLQDKLDQLEAEADPEITNPGPEY